MHGGISSQDSWHIMNPNTSLIHVWYKGLITWTDVKQNTLYIQVYNNKIWNIILKIAVLTMLCLSWTQAGRVILKCRTHEISLLISLYVICLIFFICEYRGNSSSITIESYYQSWSWVIKMWINTHKIIKKICVKSWHISSWVCGLQSQTMGESSKNTSKKVTSIDSTP